MKKKFSILIFSLVLLLNSKSYSYNIEPIDMHLNDSIVLEVRGNLYEYDKKIYFWSNIYKLGKDNFKIGVTRGLTSYFEGKLDTLTLFKYGIDSTFLTRNGILLDMAISKKGNKYLVFSDGDLLQITNDEKLISYRDLLEKYKIPSPNSVAVDDDENIYLHANGYLYKITKDTLIELANVYDEYWRQPQFLLSHNLRLVDNKLFFYNFNLTISYYDIETGKIDSLAIYDRIKDYIGDNYSPIFAEAISNKFLNLVYKVPNERLVIVNYYPENDSIAILDNILQRLLDEGYNHFGLLYLGLDKYENYFFRISDLAKNKENDTLFIINSDLYLHKIDLGKKYNKISYFNSAIRLENDDIIGRINFDRDLILISGVPSSVEDYTNWLFLDGVYPNPARDYINVDFSVEPINLPSTKVKIYDYIGREVSQLSPKIEYNNLTGMGKMTCDISEIQSGFYILVITNDKYSKSTPIYIE